MIIQTDIRDGIIIYDGVRYPLKLNDKNFSYYDGCPRWIKETAIDFHSEYHEYPPSNRSRWKFEVSNHVFYRVGFEKFGQIEECIRDFTDRGIEMGVVYNNVSCLLFIPPSLVYEESTIFNKIIHRILKITRYNFHNISPMSFLLKKNKWFNWMLRVCDLGIDFNGTHQGITHHLTDDVIIVNLVSKDTQIMIDDFFDKFLNDR
jgi:hypothetical protein